MEILNLSVRAFGGDRGICPSPVKISMKRRLSTRRPASRAYLSVSVCVSEGGDELLIPLPFRRGSGAENRPSNANNASKCLNSGSTREIDTSPFATVLPSPRPDRDIFALSSLLRALLKKRSQFGIATIAN